MRSVPPLVAVALTFAMTWAAGCGDSGDSATAALAAPSAAEAAPQDFPKVVGGETLAELQGDLPQGPVLTSAVSLLQPGENRVGFALFDVARTELTGAQVALYVARPDGTGVRGPFVARSESLAVKGGFASKTTSEDPDAATSVYVAHVPFKRKGKFTVAGLVRLDGRLMRTAPEPMTVGARGATPPGVGDRAVPIDTPTLTSAGGDIASIDTRVPPAPELHRDNLRDVLGKKPVVLVFATPQLCQSRVCGPVVDVALQVKSTVGDRVAVIHQEVYRDNKVERGVRPQLGAWHLATEPWTFVIDKAGVVRSRFEGALSVGELQRAVDAVAG